MESRQLADAVLSVFEPCVCSGIDTDEASSVSAASVRTTMTSAQTKQLSAPSLIGACCRLIDWSCNGLTPAPSSRPQSSPLIHFSPLGHPGLASPPPVGLGRERERDRAEEEYIHFAVAI
ncbi:hypothetical protein DPX16_8461 [Anabarilius grahami]|uniref:Uncharacterized protein n=1 Tax=Anabarilius grahami TaxID=495550 RepID=A0A3N0Z4L5_ANAGA|nr:hypothetical protein DPX16_8461 [Anabarilius grahami]